MARQFFREWMKRPVCNGQSTSEGKRPTLFNLLTGGGEGDVGRRREEEEDDVGLNGHFFKACAYNTAENKTANSCTGDSDTCTVVDDNKWVLSEYLAV